MKKVTSKKSKKHSLTIGKSVLIRTVTHYFTGKIKSITDMDLMLDGAAWIADTGRFGECLKNGTVSECEYIGDGHIVFLGGIIDVAQWNHPLPSVTK